MKRINFQICSSCKSWKGGIPVSGDPLRMIQNNCPPGMSFMVSVQVKFLGGGLKLAPKPPVPSP